MQNTLPEAYAQLKPNQVPKTLPRVSVIIPAKNAEKWLAVQLKALSEQTYAHPFEVVVVDDGSSDATAAIASSWQEWFEHFQCLRIPQSGGASNARNKGVYASAGDLLLFCDADDLVEPSWISEMVAALSHHDAVGGKLDRELLNSEAALAGRPSVSENRYLCQTSDFGLFPYAPAGNFGIHRRTWNVVSGYDSTFLYGSEDIDLCWRLQLAGYSIGHAPRAVVHYRFRSSLKQLLQQNRKYGTAHVQLFRSYKKLGMPRTSTLAALRDLLWCLRHVNYFWGPLEKRFQISRIASRRTGRLLGNLKYHCWYP